MPSYIPPPVKRAQQRIKIRLDEDQIALLDSYGRFITGSRDYIISQALEKAFKKDRDFARWLEQQQSSRATPAEHDEPQAARERMGALAASGGSTLSNTSSNVLDRHHLSVASHKVLD